MLSYKGRAGGRELPSMVDLGVKVTPHPFPQNSHPRVWQCTEESLWKNANIHFLCWEKEMRCRGVRSCKNNLSVLFNKVQMEYIALKWVICQLQSCVSTTLHFQTPTQGTTSSPSHRVIPKVSVIPVTGGKAAARLCWSWGWCQPVQRRWRHTQNSFGADFGILDLGNTTAIPTGHQKFYQLLKTI